jgi:hypothetical protein
MSAVIVGAGAAVLGEGYKVYTGIKQKNQANQIAKNNVFVPQTMPGQVSLATNLAADNFNNGMPGMTQAQTKIGRNAANAFYNGSQGASSGGDVLDLAARIGQNETDATNQLAGQNAMYKTQALGGYINALNNEGEWQNRLYQNNVKEPYQSKAQTAAALYGAGNINEFNGIDGAASAITTGITDYNNTQLMKNNPDLAYGIANSKLKKGGR